MAFQVRDEDLITYCGMAEKEVAMFRSAVDAVNELAEGDGGDIGGEEGEYYDEGEEDEAGAYEDGARYSPNSDEREAGEEYDDQDGMGRVVGERTHSRATPVDEDVFGYEDELEVASDDASYEEDPKAGGH